MKASFILCLLSLHLLASGQKQYTTELVLQETSFALESQIYGARYGFLKNLDTAARGLNGEGFNNLYKIWKDRKDLPKGFVLLWEPAYIYAGSDGLSGISYGPSFTKPATDTVLLHTGYYFTIWQRRQPFGPFKISFDSGIPVKGAEPSKGMSQFTLLTFQLKGGEAWSRTRVEESSKQYRAALSKNSFAAVLKEHLVDGGAILVSGEGLIKKETIASSKIGKSTVKFEADSITVVSGSLFAEWGRMEESGGRKGYYVQVWNASGNSIQLVAGFYKMD